MHFWWEGSGLQLRQLGLLLVIVVGRPLGNYIQTLITLALLTGELLYEFLIQPQRFPQVQLMQATAVCLLVYSTMTVLLFADYDKQASRGGLAAVGVIIGVANVLMFVVFIVFIVRASVEKVNKFITSVELWLWRKFQSNVSPFVAVASSRRLGRSLTGHAPVHTADD